MFLVLLYVKQIIFVLFLHNVNNLRKISCTRIFFVFLFNLKLFLMVLKSLQIVNQFGINSFFFRT